MEYYANLGGDSGVRAYEITDTAITVQFRDGAVYLYNYLSPGRLDVERMKKFAIDGRGLNAYISSVVRKRYARKIR